MDEGDPIQAAEALIASGRAPDAARALHARLAAGRGGLLARLTLIKALLASGDSDAALAAAREAVSLNPQVAVAVLALGEALLAAADSNSGALPTAIAELQRALRMDPGLVRARERIAAAWLKAGEADKALENLHALENPPADMIAACAAIKAAPRSDAGYVRHLFDQFSADYDARMIGQLAYAAPQILFDLAALVMPSAMEKKLAILDLGCGTGLAGAVFKPLAARLDGVDLSPAMIAKARARGIYDHLQVADLQTALGAAGPSYDLILAADTLVYLGDLKAVFAGARRRLRSDGFFLFTAEKADGEGFRARPQAALAAQRSLSARHGRSCRFRLGGPCRRGAAPRGQSAGGRLCRRPYGLKTDVMAAGIFWRRPSLSAGKPAEFSISWLFWMTSPFGVRAGLHAWYQAGFPWREASRWALRRWRPALSCCGDSPRTAFAWAASWPGAMRRWCSSRHWWRDLPAGPWRGSMPAWRRRTGLAASWSGALAPVTASI